MDTSIKISQRLYAKKIYAQQVRAVYGSFSISIVGSLLGAFFLMALQWDIADKKNMLQWFAVFSVAHIFRLVLSHQFNTQQPDDDVCVLWGRVFVYSAFIGGLIWATGLYITFIPGNLSYQLTITIIAVGLSIGAISSLSILPLAFIVYVSPLMLTLMVLYLLEMTYITNLIAFIIFSTMIYITRGANHNYQNTRENFKLLFEAAEREKLLVAAKETADLANKTQSEFLDNMSHELRTPLHGIMAFAQVGIERTKNFTDENILKYFTRILESGDRLKLLLDNLLDLRKVEAGKIDLNLYPKNIKNIIIKCVEQQEAVINAHNLTIDYNFDSGIPLVKCDEDRIIQVVMNLLSNAIKFSPGGEKILFSVKMSDNASHNKAVQISVADQGPGIDVEEQETIFNKFIQIKNNISNSGGTGLGLAITREIVDAHHGMVWCKNNENVGITFHFVLPV